MEHDEKIIAFSTVAWFCSGKVLPTLFKILNNTESDPTVKRIIKSGLDDFCNECPEFAAGVNYEYSDYRSLNGGLGFEFKYSVGTIPDGLLKEEFYERIHMKYTAKEMNKLEVDSPEKFFYKTFEGLNHGGGNISEDCMTNVEDIFKCLTEDGIKAIPLSETTYAKILYLFTGRKVSCYDEHKVDWVLDDNNLYGFIKHIGARSSKKNEIASKHFTINGRLWESGKDTSAYADNASKKVRFIELKRSLGLELTENERLLLPN